MERWEEYEGGTRRAPRFAFEFPLRYRSAGGLTWHAGDGRNISRSGLLFQANDPPEGLTVIEVSFLGPVRLPGEPAAAVVCQGRVVRQVPLDGLPGGTAVAATIDNYRFERSR